MAPGQFFPRVCVVSFLCPVLTCLASAFPWIFTEAPTTLDTLRTALHTVFYVLLNTWHQQLPTQIPSLVSLPTTITSNPSHDLQNGIPDPSISFLVHNHICPNHLLLSLPVSIPYDLFSTEGPERSFLKTQIRSGYSPSQDSPMAPITLRIKSKPLAPTSCPSTLLLHASHDFCNSRVFVLAADLPKNLLHSSPHGWKHPECWLSERLFLTSLLPAIL